jgi:DNA-binding response OmpR family regulator
MAGMDGFETTRAIREGTAGATAREVPIVAMTGRAMPGDREACLDVGMNDYLAKPIDPEPLLNMLRKWTRTGRREASRSPTPSMPPDLGSEARPGREDARHFDGLALVERCLLDLELARAVAQTFLESLAEEREATRAALEVGDTALSIRCLHALRGASLTIGAAGLSLEAERLETLALSGDLRAVRAHLPALFATCDATATDVRAWLARIPPSGRR